ncbi:FimV/HubP family polar landmark protein [Pseudidiomarina gelatinasegens]|uniref:FimV/HubP family polar landmark protein n=1 Tax=Pseudidiomarina gelatinasegens TaxID=2487740 RepID=UPI003A979115
MKRNTLAVAAGIALALGSSTVVTADASFVNTSAVVMLQGQAASRWQADRFGPIVSSDTLWSIAMYYGDKTDLSVYEMMDLFIELNPEAFINGRADRMMDGYYLKVPPAAQTQRAESAPVVTDEPAETARPEEVVEPESPGAVTETPNTDAENVEPATESIQFDAQELTQLRGQLAESITLIERLNSENNALQERLDSVTAQLEQMQLKMSAEQRAESDLQQQIEAELAATQQEQVDVADTTDATTAETTAEIADEQPTTAAAALTEEPDAEVTTQTEVKPEPEVEQKPAATPKPTSRKKPSDYEAFVEWLLQPFQLTLAILIPLLLAAIIWYMLYVRRLNREHLGPYNGAMQAAAKEKEQGKEESAEKLSAFEEAEQAAAAEEAAEMPEFERLDDDDDYAQLEDDVDDEATQLEDELAALDEETEASETEQPADNDEDTDLDSLLASSFDQEESTDEAEVASESQSESEPEFETLSEVEPEPEPEPEQDDTEETKAEVSNDDDMTLDFHIDDEPASKKPEPTDVDVELEQFEDISLDDIDLEGLSAEEPSDDSDSKAETELTLDEDASDEFLEIDALLEEAESEDSDFDSPRFEREAGQVDDSEETPSGILDLARAYMDMDEYELAREELEKVAASDDEDAKREAAMLLQKIEEQGH